MNTENNISPARGGVPGTLREELATPSPSESGVTTAMFYKERFSSPITLIGRGLKRYLNALLQRYFRQGRPGYRLRPSTAARGGVARRSNRRKQKKRMRSSKGRRRRKQRDRTDSPEELLKQGLHRDGATIRDLYQIKRSYYLVWRTGKV